MTSIRAVIVTAFPFSRLAKLKAEDGRAFVLTRDAEGFDQVELHTGVWLECSIAEDNRVVAGVRCSSPPNQTDAPEEDRTAQSRDREVAVSRLLRRQPSVHSVAPVAVTPSIRLHSWQVSELTSGARHVWGYDDAGREGRVSSLLAEFDPAAALLKSASGRWYELLGPPRPDPDAEYVWRAWLSVHGDGREPLSVTSEVWDAVQVAAGQAPDDGLSESDERRLHRLSARARQQIWAGSQWLDVAAWAERAGSLRLASMALGAWETQRKLFSLEKDGVKVYPAYAFSGERVPLPALEKVMFILHAFSSWGLAAWLESTSSFLGGARPRELLGTDPDRVVAAALDQFNMEQSAG